MPVAPEAGAILIALAEMSSSWFCLTCFHSRQKPYPLLQIPSLLVC